MRAWLSARWSGGVRAGGAFPRAAAGRSVRAGVAIVLLIPQLTGCFHYVPAGSAPIASGAEVRVGISDRGRVALADEIGPGVRRIEGRLVESNDTAVVLSVSSVEYDNLHVAARWMGERVELSRDHVSEVRERRLSRSRSWLMAGLVTAGLVAASLIAITGFGSDEGSTRPGDGDTGQQ